MTVTLLLALAGLALVDSTSIGTLVLPLLLLAQPRVHVGRFLTYLATVAAFYAAVGVALVAGAGVLVDAASGLGEVRGVRLAQLAVGAALLAVGVVGAPRRARASTPAGAGDPELAAVRAPGWRRRLLGPEASYGAVVGVGLVAALVEVGSMLPFLAAVGLLTAADLPVVVWVPSVLVYVLVMVLPALLLLGGRIALGGRLEPRLQGWAAWLDRRSGGAALWAAAIVGLLLVQDAVTALGWLG